MEARTSARVAGWPAGTVAGMTAPDDDELVAEEGVNEGSADSTSETNEGAGVSGALAAASETGRPAGEYDPAPPVDTDTPQTRATRDQVGPGQQVELGEG
jgi:hypothetical protein